MVEEDRQSKLPKNYHAKRMRNEWELKELEARQVIHYDFINAFALKLITRILPHRRKWPLKCFKMLEISKFFGCVRRGLGTAGSKNILYSHFDFERMYG